MVSAGATHVGRKRPRELAELFKWTSHLDALVLVLVQHDAQQCLCAACVLDRLSCKPHAAFFAALVDGGVVEVAIFGHVGRFLACRVLEEEDDAEGVEVGESL